MDCNFQNSPGSSLLIGAYLCNGRKGGIIWPTQSKPPQESQLTTPLLYICWILNVILECSHCNKKCATFPSFAWKQNSCSFRYCTWRLHRVQWGQTELNKWSFQKGFGFHWGFSSQLPVLMLLSFARATDTKYQYLKSSPIPEQIPAVYKWWPNWPECNWRLLELFCSLLQWCTVQTPLPHTVWTLFLAADAHL